MTAEAQKGKHVREYQETDVLTAARERIRNVFEQVDNVVVAFSGGKDSLVCLHLVREIAEERGERVRAFFLDEEFIPRSVVEFVDWYRAASWLDLWWFAVPLKSTKFRLGKAEDYVQWDPAREWAREKPEWAILPKPGDERVFDQYSMAPIVADRLPGKTAIIVGIRASESIARYSSCMLKLHATHITDSGDRRVINVRPIYDWEEDDVFKFLGEQGIPYCAVYDRQLWTRLGLRVSTPLHPQSAKYLDGLQRWDPELYQSVIRIFPEMAAQARYSRDLAPAEVPIAHDWETVFRWIDENLEGRAQTNAIKAARKAWRFEHKPKAGYTPAYVLAELARGGGKGGWILPNIGRYKDPTRTESTPSTASSGSKRRNSRRTTGTPT